MDFVWEIDVADKENFKQAVDVINRSIDQQNIAEGHEPW